MRLPIWAWKNTLSRLGFRVTRVHRRRGPPTHRSALESLEPRIVLASHTFAAGVLTITGDASVDQIALGTVTDGADTFVALNGASLDDIDPSDVTDVVIHGGDGNDIIDLSGVSATDCSQLANIHVYGEAGNDTLTGSPLADVLNGGAGADTLIGGAGDDTYVITGSSVDPADTITEVAGGGTDTLDLSQYAPGHSSQGYGASIDLGAGTARGVYSGTIAYISSGVIENVIGTDYDDELFGSASDNILIGGDGNDILDGGVGNDRLEGGDGDNYYTFSGTGNLGTATIVDAEDHGSDSIDFWAIGDKAQQGGTFDLNATSWSFTNSYVSLALNLSTAYLENVTGTDYDDVLTGNARDNDLAGGGGNDTYKFVDAVDQGSDYIDDYSGVDTLDFSGLDLGHGINLTLAPAAPHYYPQQIVNYGGKQFTIDGLHYSVIENVIGTQYADTITASSSGSTLDGRGGDDTLTGAAGIDTLIGGDGNDTFNSVSSSDIVHGGAGLDTPEVIDDSDTEFSTSGTWNTNASVGFDSTQKSVQNNSAATANWTFSNLPAGTYRVLSTWSSEAGTTFSSVAPFTISNGVQVVSSTVDESSLPSTSNALMGRNWSTVGFITVSAGGEVVVSLHGLTSGTVAADVVRLEAVTQTPDVSITGFSVDGTQLSVSYVITNSQFPYGQAVPQFSIGVYASPDGSANSQVLKATYVVSNSNDLTAGSHTVYFDAGSSFNFGATAEDIDCYLRAVIDSGNAITETSETNNSLVFQAGASVAADGTIQVQGTDDAESFMLNGTSLTIGATVYTYNLTSSTGYVYLRMHGGNDDLTTSSEVMKSLFAYGGAGNDALEGGSN